MKVVCPFCTGCHIPHIGCRSFPGCLHPLGPEACYCCTLPFFQLWPQNSCSDPMHYTCWSSLSATVPVSTDTELCGYFQPTDLSHPIFQTWPDLYASWVQKAFEGQIQPTWPLWASESLGIKMSLLVLGENQSDALGIPRHVATMSLRKPFGPDQSTPKSP